jgi:hypothetical protein
MIPLNQYLKTEAQRYFPDSKLTVRFNEETTIIKLKYPSDNKLATYICEAGSDDDWFVFNDKDGCLPSFTIPLQPEE